MALALPTQVRPSIRQGFYSPRTGGVARYPELWEKMLGAWAPVLGNTFETVHDWSVGGHDAEFAGNWGTDRSDDWQRVNGYESVRCATHSTDTYLDTNHRFAVTASDSFSCLVWVTFEAITSFKNVAGQRNGTSYNFSLRAGTGLVPSVLLASGSVNGTTVMSNGPLYCLAFTFENGNTSLYLDGKLEATGTSGSPVGSAIDFYIGGDPTNGSTRGFIHEVLYAGRAWSAKEVALLSSKPGVLYERRSPVFSIPTFKDRVPYHDTRLITLPARNVRPSIRQGFYSPRTGGKPAHPELWEGCAFAWDSGLGVSDVLRDHCCKRADGTLSGATPPSWEVNYGQPCLNYDGSTSYTNAGSQTSTGLFSVGGWGWKSTTAGVQTLTCHGNSSANISGFMLRPGTVNGSGFTSATSQYRLATFPQIPVNTWTHMFMTHDGQTLRFYVNGVLVLESAQPYTAQISTQTIAIGRLGAYNGQYWNGGIRDVRVYDRTLSDDEVKLLASGFGVAYERRLPAIPTYHRPTDYYGLIKPRRQNTTPSIRQGFYSPRTGGRPAHPELWDGCVGAAAPSLGAFGQDLEDLSGRGHKGVGGYDTLESYWQTTIKDGHFVFDGGAGANNFYRYVRFAGMSSGIAGLQQASLSAWVYVGSGETAFVGCHGSRKFGFAISPTSMSVGCATSLLISATGTPGTGWHHVAIVYDGTKSAGADPWDRCKLYVDGVEFPVPRSGTDPDSTMSTAAQLGDFGLHRIGVAGLTGSYGEFQLFNRTLSLNEVRSLSSRHLLPYELAYAQFGRTSFDDTVTPEVPAATTHGLMRIPLRATPSIRQGFYSPRTGGIPAHPELWDGIVAAWGLGLGPATVVKNLTGAHVPDGSPVAGDSLHGVLNGVPCFEFDSASQQYISIPDSDVLSFGDSVTDDQFSISAWVYVNNLSASRPIVAKYTNITGTFEGEWQLTILSSGTLILQLLDNLASVRCRVDSASGAITAGRWYHVASTYTGGGTDESISLFIDGSQVPVTPYGGDTSYVAMHNRSIITTIGASVVNDATYSSYMDGGIAEVLLHRRVLTNNQIKKLASRPFIAYERLTPFFGSSPSEETPTTVDTGQVLLIPNRTTPSFRQGFYSPLRGGFPAHPELWQDCLVAAPMGMGEFGGSFREQISGRIGTNSVGYNITRYGFLPYYDGTTSSAGLVPVAGLHNDNVITVSFWMKFDQDTSTRVVFEYGTPNYSVVDGFIFYHQGGDNRFYAIMSKVTGGSATNGVWISDTAIPDNEWSHVVIVFNRTTGTSTGVDIFVDGIAPSKTANGSGNLNSTNFDSTVDEICMMARDGGTLLGKGHIADFRVYRGDKRHLVEKLGRKPFLAYERRRPMIAQTPGATTGGPTVYVVSGSDVLTLTDVSSTIGTFNVTATETITLTDTGSAALTYPVDGSDTVTFTDVGSSGSVIIVSGADTVLLTDSATVALTYPVDGSDTVTLTDSSDGLLVFSVTASDTVTFSEATTRSATRTVSASDTVTLTDSGSGAFTFSVTGSDTVSLGESDSTPTAYVVSATDTVVFTDSGSASPAITVTGADTITFTDQADVTIRYAVSGSDTITFTETTVSTYTFPVTASDTVTLTDAGQIATTYIATGSDTVVFSDVASVGAVFAITAADSIAFTDAGFVVVFDVGQTVSTNVWRASRRTRAFVASRRTRCWVAADKNSE